MRTAAPTAVQGGPPGFVRVIAEDTLAFPDYKGNGQFRSLGNILVNPQVALCSSTSSTPGGAASTGSPRCTLKTRCWPTSRGPN